MIEWLRLALGLSAVACGAQLAVLLWQDRHSDRWLAQAALLVTLGTIAGDSALRIGQHAPFELHLFLARGAIVTLTWAYVLRRLTGHQPGAWRWPHLPRPGWWRW